MQFILFISARALVLERKVVHFQSLKHCLRILHSEVISFLENQLNRELRVSNPRKRKVRFICIPSAIGFESEQLEQFHVRRVVESKRSLDVLLVGAHVADIRPGRTVRLSFKFYHNPEVIACRTDGLRNYSSVMRLATEFYHLEVAVICYLCCRRNIVEVCELRKAIA